MIYLFFSLCIASTTSISWCHECNRDERLFYICITFFGYGLWHIKCRDFIYHIHGSVHIYRWPNARERERESRNGGGRCMDCSLLFFPSITSKDRSPCGRMRTIGKKEWSNFRYNIFFLRDSIGTAEPDTLTISEHRNIQNVLTQSQQLHRKKLTWGSSSWWYPTRPCSWSTWGSSSSPSSPSSRSPSSPRCASHWSELKLTMAASLAQAAAVPVRLLQLITKATRRRRRRRPRKPSSWRRCRLCPTGRYVWRGTARATDLAVTQFLLFLSATLGALVLMLTRLSWLYDAGVAPGVAPASSES